MYVPGAIFGVMVSAYFAIFLRYRSWAKLLAFVAATVVGYFVAVWLTVLTVMGFARSELSREASFFVGMFVGGTVGGLITLITAQLFLSVRRKWKAALGAATMWSLAGGGLGAAGWALGGSVGKALWLALYAMRLTFTDADVEAAIRTQTVNVFSLFVLWQPGMAAILGWLVSKSSATQPEHQSAASSA